MWRESPFDKWFKKMMERLLKDLEGVEKEFKEIRKPPEFVVRMPEIERRAGGFSIRISSNGRTPPKIEVRRFGPRGWEKITPEMEPVVPFRKLPVKAPIAVPEKKPLVEIKKRTMPEFNVAVNIKEVKIVMDAPDVESKDDVKVTFYPESIELRAVSRKRSTEYFCTIALPTSIDRKKTVIDVTKEKVIVRIPRLVGGLASEVGGT